MSVSPAGRRAWGRRRLLLIVLLFAGASAVAAPHLWAWHHYREGQSALARYHFAEARQELATPLKAWPSCWRVQLLAARAARLDGDAAAAEEHLNRCQDLQATNAEVLLEWALLRAATGDLARVEDYLWSRGREEPSLAPLILEALVEGYVLMYRLSEARACLDDWLKRQPEDTQALYPQGCLWQQVQKPQSALDSFRRVIAMDAARDDARWRLAQCLVKVSAPGEAIAHLEFLHRRYPENTDMTVELARARFKEAQLDAARRLLDEVLANHPDNVPALTERARLALAEEDAARAVGWLRQAIAYNPREAQALRLLAAALRQQGQRDEAQALQDQLAKMDDDFKRLAEICLNELGKRKSDPALHCELGKLLLRLGYPEAGRAWLQRALSEDPDNASARAALANSSSGSDARVPQHR